MEKVNIKDKLGAFNETWVPKIVGELNGQHVKVVKAKGEYIWHHHEAEDEMFLVAEGRMEIHLRDQIVALDPGEFLIVSRGVEHKPVVPEGVASILLFEPAATRNTGNVDHALTIEAKKLEKI